MLRALRRSRLVSCLAVFVLFTVLPAAFPLWHGDGDDPYCSPQLIVHDHNAHQIAATEHGPASPEHCLLCHWAQSLRGATIASRFVLPGTTSARLLGVELAAHATTTAAGPTGRAPPVVLLSAVLIPL